MSAVLRFYIVGVGASTTRMVGELTHMRSMCVGVAETGGKALLNDFWYFSSRKSTIKEKLLYLSSRVIDIIKQNTTTPSHTKISIKREENSLLSLKKVPLYVIL